MLIYANQIYTRLSIVLIPLFIALCFKTYRGYYWWLKDSGRNSFLRYFNISWVYFLAADVEFLLIGITSTDTLGSQSYLYLGLMVTLSLPIMFVLYLQNKHLEELHFKLIDLRQATLKRKPTTKNENLPYFLTSPQNAQVLLQMRQPTVKGQQYNQTIDLGSSSNINQ